jgi:hypothetical protein
MQKQEWEVAREKVLERYPKAFYGRVSCSLFESLSSDNVIGRGATHKEALIDAAQKLAPPAPPDLLREAVEALKKLLETHSCDSGEADYKAEWDGDHTVCDDCKPAWAILYRYTATEPEKEERDA